MKTICEYDKVIFDDILKDIDKYAKDFSENDPKLENALKLLWKNGFETTGCCKGHDNKKAYIGIKVKDISKTTTLLSALNKNNIIISFLKYNDSFNCSIKSYNKSDIFTNIINSIDQKSIDNNIKEILNKLEKRKSKDYLNVHLYYKDSIKPDIYINTTDLKLINEYKNKYDYKLLNEKINMYHFDLK